MMETGLVVKPVSRAVDPDHSSLCSAWVCSEIAEQKFSFERDLPRNSHFCRVWDILCPFVQLEGH